MPEKRYRTTSAALQHIAVCRFTTIAQNVHYGFFFFNIIYFRLEKSNNNNKQIIMRFHYERFDNIV